MGDVYARRIVGWMGDKEGNCTGGDKTYADNYLAQEVRIKSEAK